MSSTKLPGRLRTITPEVALKRLGLKFFLGEEDPAASLIRAALAHSERARPSHDADPGEDEDGVDAIVPEAFARHHASGIETRQFFTQRNRGAICGFAVFGAVWSPGSKTGLFVMLDTDSEMSAPLLGFSYTDPLTFTLRNLKPLMPVLADNLGAAAGVEEITNYAPELFPDSFFVGHYLDHHAKHRSDSEEPFILVYKEPKSSGGPLWSF